MLDQNPAILIVALGANDGIRGVEGALVRRNLSTIIERAQARQIRVLLCGMEAPPFYGWNYTLAFHEIFPDLARNTNVPLVPFLLAKVALNPEMNGEDLIHPNAAGADRSPTPLALPRANAHAIGRAPVGSLSQCAMLRAG